MSWNPRPSGQAISTSTMLFSRSRKRIHAEQGIRAATSAGPLGDVDKDRADRLEVKRHNTDHNRARS